jgi:hypothetical protein
LNMSPSMYVGGMFWKQICHNPDDGDRAGPWNIWEFQPINIVDSLRYYLLLVNRTVIRLCVLYGMVTIRYSFLNIMICVF